MGDIVQFAGNEQQPVILPKSAGKLMELMVRLGDVYSDFRQLDQILGEEVQANTMPSTLTVSVQRAIYQSTVMLDQMFFWLNYLLSLTRLPATSDLLTGLDKQKKE